jgi:hypothetical protein
VVARTLVLVGVLAVGLSSCATTPADSDGTGGLPPFPAGYIDSPFVVSDGSTLYFIHSVVSTYDIIVQNPDAQPSTPHLAGHQGAEGPYWWNTDLYLSRRNPDGTWGMPENLGPTVNTVHMESGPWVNAEQTMLIFTRESVDDPSASGSFVAVRESADDPWGEPVRLPGELGDYGSNGFSDFHLAPGGDLYFWGGIFEGTGDLYRARSTGPGEWAAAELLPGAFRTADDETQPWLSDDETVFLFNRRGDDGDTSLWRSTRSGASDEWGEPEEVVLTGFADAGGLAVWGEPCVVDDGTLFFMRFDTSVEDWIAQIMMAPLNPDGSYGPPEPVALDRK